MSQQTRQIPARSLLFERNFLLLSLGQGLSRLGDGLYVAALAWTAWTLTLDTGAVALVMLAANLPVFFGSVIGASFADRYDRKRLMIGCDLLRTLLVAVLALLLQFGNLNVVGLALGAVLIGLAGAPFAPARNAIVPQIVPSDKLLVANGLLQVSFRSAFFVGPLLFAPLINLFSLSGVFVVNALTFVCSFLTLAAMRITSSQTRSSPLGLWADLAAGWQVLQKAPEVLIVIITFILAILMASGFLSVGLTALVETNLHGGASEYGLLLGVAGLSEVAGALLLARLPLPNFALSAVLAWAILGLFRLPLGLVGSLPLAASLLIMTGLASAVTDIPLIALVQARIPDYHLAKVLGLWEAGITGAVALSPPIASLALNQVGIAGGFVISGLMLIILGLGAALIIKRLPVGSK